jgi:hypothetical protein
MKTETLAEHLLLVSQLEPDRITARRPDGPDRQPLGIEVEDAGRLRCQVQDDGAVDPPVVEIDGELQVETFSGWLIGVVVGVRVESGHVAYLEVGRVNGSSETNLNYCRSKGAG